MKRIGFILIISLCGCSYHNLGKQPMESPSLRTKAKSTFLLAYMVAPPYAYNDTAAIREMPKYGFEKDKIIVLTVRVIDAFRTKKEYSTSIMDSVEVSIYQYVNKKYGLTKEQVTQRAYEKNLTYKTVYFALKKKSDERMFNLLFNNKRTFLLRSNYIDLSTDTTMFTESLYMPKKRYFKHYLEKYH